MTFNEAIKRLRFTISKKNKPNATDVQALNEVLLWVKNQKEDTIYNYRLFAKLYLERLAKEIVFNKSEYNYAINKIENELKKPLELFYEAFAKEMRYNTINVFGELIGVDKPLEWMNEERREKARKKIGDNSDVFIKILESDFWSVENTIPRLNDLITDVINSNKHLA